jgi:hypothetical protein
VQRSCSRFIIGLAILNQMEDKHWKRHTPQELEAKIKDQPITEESLRMLASSSCIQISGIPFENPKSQGLTMYCGCENGIPRYHVVLNRLSPHEDCIETFAHELVHIHYRCGATYSDGENGRLVEEIIERESAIAVTKYPHLIASILEACPKV